MNMNFLFWLCSSFCLCVPLLRKSSFPFQKYELSDQNWFSIQAHLQRQLNRAAKAIYPRKKISERCNFCKDWNPKDSRHSIGYRADIRLRFSDVQKGIQNWIKDLAWALKSWSAIHHRVLKFWAWASHPMSHVEAFELMDAPFIWLAFPVL